MHDKVTAEYTEWVLKEIEELPTNEQVRVVRRISVLEGKGWSVSARDDDIKHLDGEIWELRVLGKGAAYRVLFFQVPGDPGRIVVLTSCVAKSQAKKRATGNAEVERAKRRREVWLKQQEEGE